MPCRRLCLFRRALLAAALGVATTIAVAWLIAATGTPRPSSLISAIRLLPVQDERWFGFVIKREDGPAWTALAIAASPVGRTLARPPEATSDPDEILPGWASPVTAPYFRDPPPLEWLTIEATG